jgi:hypothetical protein
MTNFWYLEKHDSFSFNNNVGLKRFWKIGIENLISKKFTKRTTEIQGSSVNKNYFKMKIF